MKKLLVLVCILGMLAFAGNAIGFSFGFSQLSYSRSTSFSYAPTGFGTSFSSSSIYVPTGFGISTSYASACANCFTLDTSTDSRFDETSGVMSVGAYAFVDTTECEDPSCADTDQDQVCDYEDNCIDDYNPDQTDTDQDGFGDICDNCVAIENDDQLDSDGNGIGDACDECPDQDTDGDGICDGRDNCVDDYNPDQIDDDKDGVGDVCDECVDIDDDQICDDVDYCLDDPDNLCLPVLCPCNFDPETDAMWSASGLYQRCIVQEAENVGCASPIAADSSCAQPITSSNEHECSGTVTRTENSGKSVEICIVADEYLPNYDECF